MKQPCSESIQIWLFCRLFTKLCYAVWLSIWYKRALCWCFQVFFAEGKICVLTHLLAAVWGSSDVINSIAASHWHRAFPCIFVWNNFSTGNTNKLCAGSTYTVGPPSGENRLISAVIIETGIAFYVMIATRENFSGTNSEDMMSAESVWCSSAFGN